MSPGFQPIRVMKLRIEHTFAVPPAEYARIYFEESFNEAMGAAVKVGRTLLRLERTPARVFRQVRCEPERDLPAPIAKMLAGRRFHYLEEIDFDLTKRAGSWRVVPSVVPEKVTAGGALAFEPVTAGTKRVVSGAVDVHAFGIGTLIERFVVADVQRSYDQVAAFTRDFLASVRPSART